MKTAVLLTCHGTVERVEDLPEFLQHIRHGRPVPSTVLEEVKRRFEHIGGSPLMRITQAQADALADRVGLPVVIAARHFHPYPGDVLASLYGVGIRRVISLPLAPPYVEIYHKAVVAAAAQFSDLEVVSVPWWGEEQALVDAFVEVIDEGLALFPEGVRSQVFVVLTAHSLPQRVIDAGDPYERRFRTMAEAVTRRMMPEGHRTTVAFQSQGMTNEAWLGPDLPSTFERLFKEGVRDMLIAPIGFVSDHVETLYDLDVEAKAIGKKIGFSRVERALAVNTRPRFVDALEALVRRWGIGMRDEG